MKFLETRKMSSADRMLSSRAWLLALAFVISPAAVAQNSNQYAPQAQIGLTAPLSDLARQNMDRVAATAAQIKAVLIKDTGLMVELKRWVAKDATDHGQLITDSDLTDETVFSRLETDVQFRSVATALVQKFGYLLPQVNPDSPQGKEQELLIKERAKWQAQDEEEQLTAARQRQTIGGMQQTQACDPRLDPNCNVQRTYPATAQPQQIGIPVPNQIGSPSGNPPNAPNNPQITLPGLEKARLLQQQGTQGGLSNEQPETAYNSMLPPLTGMSPAGPGTLASMENGSQSPSGQLPSSTSNMQGIANAASAMGLSSETQLNATNMNGFSAENSTEPNEEVPAG